MIDGKKSTVKRALGAIAATLLVGVTGVSSADTTSAQAASKSKSSQQYIVIKTKTMPQAFTQAKKQDSKIIGCWLQKNKTWECLAKPTQPTSHPSPTTPTTTLPGSTLPGPTLPGPIGPGLPSDGTVPDVGPLPPVVFPPTSSTTTTKPTTTTTRPPTTTTTTPPAPSGAVPGTVGPTSSNLTTHNGLTITTNGAVVTGVNVIGEIRVKANNVTIRNFRANNVYKDPGYGGLLLEDGEIHGAQNNQVNGVVWSDYTARRLNIHNVDDAFKAHGNVLIENCWVHDLAFFYNGGSWTHNDGVQVSSGSNVTVRNSRFEGIQGTAAIFIKPDQGSISNVTISNNILGGGAYTLYSQSKSGSNPTNINILNNTFLEEHIYGYLYIDNPNTVVSGNKKLNGQPVN